MDTTRRHVRLVAGQVMPHSKVHAAGPPPSPQRYVQNRRTQIAQAVCAGGTLQPLNGMLICVNPACLDESRATDACAAWLRGRRLLGGRRVCLVWGASPASLVCRPGCGSDRPSPCCICS